MQADFERATDLEEAIRLKDEINFKMENKLN